MRKIVLRKRKEEEEDNPIAEFLYYAKRSFFFAGFFSLFINLLMLLPSIYMLAVYDVVVPSRSPMTLVMITLLVVFLYIISGTLQTIRSKLLVRINAKLDEFMRDRVINSTFDFALKHPSKASTQPVNDFQQIKQFLSGPTVTAFFDVPWIPIYLGVLFIFHKYYGIWATVVIFLVLTITLLNEFFTKKYLKEANEALIKSNKALNQLVQNVEVIEAMGMRGRIYKRWLQLHNKYISAMKRASDKGNFWSNLLKTTRIMSQSLMLGLGGYLAINLQITSGMIVAGSILLGRTLAPIDLIVNTWRNFSSARFSYKRLKTLLSEFKEKPKPMKLPPPKGEVFLEQIVVVPPDSEEPVIRNLTLRINPGEVVAIIGPNGAGKSSLARVMVGVWHPVAGEVRIDGASIEQWDREYLGQFIGYLPQDIELFEGTVAENIARFEEVVPEKVLRAALLSGAHEAIIKLPQGYNTYIGPGGVTLSGGMRQRIALARALYGDPKIVVLDEPNSNLDDAGEKALIKALWELKKRKVTTVFISHKPNLLEIADKIAFIQDGILRLYGPADQVIAQLSGNRKGN